MMKRISLLISILLITGLTGCVNTSAITDPQSNSDSLVLVYLDYAEYEGVVNTIKIDSDPTRKGYKFEQVMSQLRDKQLGNKGRSRKEVFYSRFIQSGNHSLSEVRGYSSYSQQMGNTTYVYENYYSLNLGDSFTFTTGKQGIYFLGSYKVVRQQGQSKGKYEYSIIKDPNGPTEKEVLEAMLRSKNMKDGKWKQMILKRLAELK